MKLYILRHGEAKLHHNDELRPLTDKGVNDIKRIAKRVKTKGVIFTTILHSGMLRTEQTAAIFSKEFDNTTRVAKTADLLPNDNVLTWVNKLMKHNDDLVLVGHLPFLDSFVSMLITDSVRSRIVGFNPGTFACLERNDVTLQWDILYILHPELN